MKCIKVKLSWMGVKKIVSLRGSSADKIFLDSLWKYAIYAQNVNRIFVSCPYCNKNHSFKKMYNYKDSQYCKLEYSNKDVTIKLGNAMMYIFREDGKVLYEVPDLFYHFFAEHNMIPKESFREAVLKGVKPGTRRYHEYMQCINIKK